MKDKTLIEILEENAQHQDIGGVYYESFEQLRDDLTEWKEQKEQEVLKGKVFNRVEVTEEIHVPKEIIKKIERKKEQEVVGVMIKELEKLAFTKNAQGPIGDYRLGITQGIEQSAKYLKSKKGE